MLPARSGPNALDTLDASFHAVLLDLTDGGAPENWRALIAWARHVPVIALVERGAREKALNAIRAGAQDVVMGPLDEVTDLAFVLEKAVLRCEADAAENEHEQEAPTPQRQLFRELAESLPQLVWRALPDGTVDYYNRRYAEFAGLEKQEDGTWQWRAVLHPDDEQPTAEAWQRAVATGQPYEIEHRALRAGGEYRWQLSRAFPVRDDQGNVVRWYGTATDIHDQKLAEQAARDSRTLIQQQLAEIEAIYDTAPVGLCFLDTNLRYVRVNGRLAEMNGVPVAQHMGRTVYEIVPEVADMAAPLIRRVIDTGEPILRLELVGKTPAQPGVTRAWEESFLPLKNGSGQVIGVNIVAEEITERKQADERLQHYGLLIRHVWDAILSVDREYRIQSWNHAAEVIYGWTAEEVQGKVLFDVLQSRYPSREYDDVIRQLESQGFWHGEVIHTRKDGTTIYALASKTMLYDEKGERIGMVAVNHDITERKQAEARIRELNADLERRVQERTAQLVDLNQEIESFSYSVSHDLRTPLRALDGFSQVLLEDYHDVLDEEAQFLLGRIRAASQRMSHLIDDLLKLSRLTRAEIRHDQINLSDLAWEIVDDLQRDNTHRQVEITIQPDLTAVGDAHLLGILLENLFGNAWKFTRMRDPARIEFGCQDEDGRSVYFVRDNGVGFNSAYSGKLFTAFQRLHSESEFEGTGIGLATVKRIVHRHDGKVWAEGAVDQGATFYFTLAER
ncbi:MAG TPA: PAS domain-containing protein [Aggregatilinea sp.]|nr:PAS domain-containing protein [Aggregatilinea sp.]